ncbi:MAG: Bax inhibitor-1/YccA family protein, partial [Bacteroidota bacterium]
MSRFSKRRFSQSSNPFMREDAYRNSASEPLDAGLGQADLVQKMTVQGAINKTFLLTALLLLTAVFSYSNPSPLFMWGGAIGGLVVVLIAAFRPKHSPILAPIYALLEGFFVGSISAMYATFMGG